jgi:hypothetical protein
VSCVVAFCSASTTGIVDDVVRNLDEGAHISLKRVSEINYSLLYINSVWRMTSTEEFFAFWETQHVPLIRFAKTLGLLSPFDSSDHGGCPSANALCELILLALCSPVQFPRRFPS